MNTHMPLAIPGYLELKYDDFKITDKLAEGGAGLVYNASLREPKPNFPANVALKIMKGKSIVSSVF